MRQSCTGRGVVMGVVAVVGAITTVTRGEEFVLVEQVRSVTTLADALECAPQGVFGGEVAPDFGVFDAASESALACALMSSTSRAMQHSTIEPAGMMAVGSARSETVTQVFNGVQAVSGSSFTVDFALSVPTRIALTGQLSVAGTADPPAPIWIAAAVTLRDADGTALVDQLLVAAQDGVPVVDPIEHNRLLPPGTYSIHVRADASITDAIPTTATGDSSFVMALEPFSLADINTDGVVNVLDLLILLTQLGPCDGCTADLNLDGVVNVLDLLLLLGDWGM